MSLSTFELYPQKWASNFSVVLTIVHRCKLLDFWCTENFIFHCYLLSLLVDVDEWICWLCDCECFSANIEWTVQTPSHVILVYNSSVKSVAVAFAARRCASAVYAVIVCLSVHLSVTLVLYQNGLTWNHANDSNSSFLVPKTLAKFWRGHPQWERPLEVG